MKKSTYIEYDSKIVWEKNSTKILPFSGSSNVFELISGSASISICTLPAHRTPSFINSRTTVFINLKAMRVERWLESNFSSKIDTKHSISVIPANLVQTYEWQQPVSFAALTIEEKYIYRKFYELTGKNFIEIIPTFPQEDPVITCMLLSLIGGLKSDSQFNQIYFESALSYIICHLIKYYSNYENTIQVFTEVLSESQLLQIDEYIRCHLDQNIKIGDLANLLHMCESSFSSSLKKTNGLTPVQYLTKFRLRKAAMLLRHTEFSVPEIAKLTGFGSGDYLRRKFVVFYKITPLKYRSEKRL